MSESRQAVEVYSLSNQCLSLLRPVYTTYQSLPQASRNFGGGVGLQLGPVGFGLAGGLGPNGLNAGGGLGFANYQNYGTPGHYKQYYTRYPSIYQNV